MSLLQNKKLSLHIIPVFLVIVLLTFYVQVHAVNTDKRGMAESLWKQGRKEDMNSLSYLQLTLILQV